MSGAKAVRVITRDERIANSKRLLAGLDAQVKEWCRLGGKIGVITGDDKTSILKTSDMLHALLESDAFDQIERQVPTQIEYLQNVLEERIEKKASIQQNERTKLRRLKAAAAEIVEMIGGSGLDIDSSIAEVLNDAASGKVTDVDALDRSISIVIHKMASSESNATLTDEQKKYAQQLEGTGDIETLSNWIANRSHDGDSLRTKVDSYIASLEIAEGQEVASHFADRAKIIEVEPDLRKKRLLLDSLMLDLAAEVNERKQKRALFVSITTLHNQFGEVQELREKKPYKELENIIKNWESSDAEIAEKIIGRAASTFEEYNRHVAAKARRVAMLEAFSQLGYEIQEGLETAWVKDKRVVIKKSATNDHGVELSGLAEGGRLQAQAVRFASPSVYHDKQHDIDIEATWCSEFQELIKIFEKGNGEVSIELAKAIGESPVKVIATNGTKIKRDRERERPIMKTRRKT